MSHDLSAGHVHEDQTGTLHYTYKSNRKIVVLSDSIQIQVDKTRNLRPGNLPESSLRFTVFEGESVTPDEIEYHSVSGMLQ